MCRCPPRRRRRSKRPDSPYSHDLTPSQERASGHKQARSQAQQCSTLPPPTPTHTPAWQGLMKAMHQLPDVCVCVQCSVIISACGVKSFARSVPPSLPILHVLSPPSNLTVCVLCRLCLPLCPCVCACASPLDAARHAHTPPPLTSSHACVIGLRGIDRGLRVKGVLSGVLVWLMHVGGRGAIVRSC